MNQEKDELVTLKTIDFEAGQTAAGNC